jgi:hypothetical protein
VIEEGLHAARDGVDRGLHAGHEQQDHHGQHVERVEALAFDLGAD